MDEFVRWVMPSSGWATTSDTRSWLFHTDTGMRAITDDSGRPGASMINTTSSAARTAVVAQPCADKTKYLGAQIIFHRGLKSENTGTTREKMNEYCGVLTCS